MRQDLKEKKASIKLERRENIKLFLYFFILGFILLVFSYINGRYINISILIKYNYIIVFIGIMLEVLAYLFATFLNEEDRVFLKIMDSLELLDKGKTPDILKHAANKLDDASKKLEKFLEKKTERVNPSWYSYIREKENDFAKKLRYRAVPALKNGKLTVYQLERIAYVFKSQDTEFMKTVNKMLENFDEIETISRYEIFLRSFYRSRTGKPVIALISGFSMIFGLSWIYATLFNQDYYEIISNPNYIIIGGIACATFIYSILKRES